MWAEAQTDNTVTPQLPEGQMRQMKKEKGNGVQNKGNANAYRDGFCERKWLQRGGLTENRWSWARSCC